MGGEGVLSCSITARCHSSFRPGVSWFDRLLDGKRVVGAALSYCLPLRFSVHGATGGCRGKPTLPWLPRRAGVNAKYKQSREIVPSVYAQMLGRSGLQTRGQKRLLGIVAGEMKTQAIQRCF